MAAIVPQLEKPVPCQEEPEFVHSLEGPGAERIFSNPTESIRKELRRIASFCDDCPLKLVCRAQCGRGFTGVAGGEVYVNGRARRLPNSTLRRNRNTRANTSKAAS